MSILCTFLYGIYNAFFHPLSKYPGPPLWTSYRLLYTIRNIQGVLPFRVLEFHRRYGPVVRIAPNELSFIDKAAWQDIYGLLPDRTQNRKDREAYTPDTPGRNQGIIHANDADHAKLRKIYAPAFSSQALEEQSKMLTEFADLLVNQLQKAASKNPVQDMTRWYNFVTFDITGRFAIGKSSIAWRMQTTTSS
ncbi:hypothetical protein PRZ48_011266 [Zasmidium cellare]|uniref:Cytochrome P450 n=1 Tax=Zasmidium cellare TaxID=395010 RepID=A0ABR0EAV5_ZASCE|nr:hypothetical protein PRZ48_011266 [Zasmidium cellare]